MVKALSLYLFKIEPCNVLFSFDWDAARLGFFIAQAIHFVAPDDEDLATVTVTVLEQIKDKKQKVLELFDSGETVKHYEGECQLVALLTQILTWAGIHKTAKGIIDAKVCSAQQVG